MILSYRPERVVCGSIRSGRISRYLYAKQRAHRPFPLALTVSDPACALQKAAPYARRLQLPSSSTSAWPCQLRRLRPFNILGRLSFGGLAALRRARCNSYPARFSRLIKLGAPRREHDTIERYRDGPNSFLSPMTVTVLFCPPPFMPHAKRPHQATSNAARAESAIQSRVERARRGQLAAVDYGIL
jgi:hypothetical protein